ncbi:MAG: CvpA family protein [Gammaproteobacteria bacterium]|nr:CvpA family protein [Gammaproteobacteria bacterium]
MVQSFNILDWGIFIVMILSVLMGFFLGLIRSFISTLIWGLSFFVSMMAGPTLSGVFGNLVGSGVLQLWLTYAAVFIATLVISMVARLILRFMLTPNQIGFFDRLGGAGLGWVRGMLMVSVFLWFMVLSGFGGVQGGLYQTSILAGWFQPYVNLVSRLFPSVGAAIQGAGQQLGGQQNQQAQQNQSSLNNNPAPIDQAGGPNPYKMMGQGGGSGTGGLNSDLPGMQSVMPWINTLWNMMVNQIEKIL